MASDINTVFCTALAVFGNGTTVASTDWLNFLVAQDNAPKGDIEVEIIVTTSFGGGTGAVFQLTAVDAAGANPVVLDQTPQIANAALVTTAGGTRIMLRMSPKSSLPASTLTHLRVQCVNVGNNNAGAISAQLVPSAHTASPNKSYAAGY
jgi:hypothetical protein